MRLQVILDGKELSDEIPLENELEVEASLRGILKALRHMLRTPELTSVLERCATVMRRHDDMAKQLGRGEWLT